jgi:hypothetical protein
MKKSILLLFSIFLCFSCKKNSDEIQQLRFAPTFADMTKTINYDSIDYTAISYCDISEPHDTLSVNMDIRTEYLSLRSNHTYAFLKFEMVGISGKVMYYIPERTDNSLQDGTFKLPMLFRIPEDSGSTLIVDVVRWSND